MILMRMTIAYPFVHPSRSTEKILFRKMLTFQLIPTCMWKITPSVKLDVRKCFGKTAMMGKFFFIHFRTSTPYKRGKFVCHRGKYKKKSKLIRIGKSHAYIVFIVSGETNVFAVETCISFARCSNIQYLFGREKQNHLWLCRVEKRVCITIQINEISDNIVLSISFKLIEQHFWITKKKNSFNFCGRKQYNEKKECKFRRKWKHKTSINGKWWKWKIVNSGA